MANTIWNSGDLALCTLSGGNLTATSTGTTGYVRAVDKALAGSGKYYWEVTAASVVGANFSIGFCPVGLSSPSGATAAGLCGVYTAGNIWVNGGASGSNIGSFSSGSVIIVALDIVAKLVWFRNGAAGNWNGSGTANPGTGTGGISVASITSSDACPLVTFSASGNQAVANFGDSAFSGAVPAGFTAGFLGGGGGASTQGARAMVLA